MEETLFKNYDPVAWWIDRMFVMQFIHEQQDSQMNPAFYWHMLREADRTNFNAGALM